MARVTSLCRPEDIAANREGRLSPRQKRRLWLSVGGWFGLAAANLVTAAIGIVRSQDEAGPLAFLAGAVGFAGLALWMSRDNLAVIAGGAMVSRLEGRIALGLDDGRTVAVTLGPETFQLTPRQARGLQDGRRYAFHYIDTPRMFLSWRAVG